MNITTKGEKVEYTVQPALTFAKQNRAGDTSFYATFETVSFGVFRSVMNVITEFELIDDQEKVEFYLIPAYPTGIRQDFEKTVTIKGFLVLIEVYVSIVISIIVKIKILDLKKIDEI